jgi:DNA-binding NarL/FixJ family response regulator
MIKVAIVEDQTIVREGLVRLLELAKDISVVATAINGKDIISLISIHKPDILLLDIQMPEADGFDVLKKLQGLDPSPSIIVLTTFNDINYLNRSKSLGANAFLLKDVSLDQLVSTIKKVHDGETLFPSTCNNERQDHTLTPREQEVMQLMANGKANKEIARTLEISEGTVKNHISNILSKYGVRDRTQAVIEFRKI